MIEYILTSGTAYTEIDTLACVITYKNYLDSQGISSCFLLSKTFNESISPTIWSWIEKIDLVDMFLVTEKEKVILLDISDPEQLFQEVNINNVVLVYDHHFGFESFWHNRIGMNSHIEFIGACATLIYETVKNNSFLEHQPLCINLLYSAIIANTLNLKAQLTSVKDITAANELRGMSNLPSNWPERYFMEIDSIRTRNPIESIKKDTKIQKINSNTYVISQMELWNSKFFLETNKELIKETIKSYQNPHWFFTSPSIWDGKTYIYTDSKTIQSLLTDLIGVEFKENGIGISENLWLRKEIIKKIKEL